jgi:hypothetical protein
MHLTILRSKELFRSYVRKVMLAIKQCHAFLYSTAVLCGPLGFEDFMRPDWMEMVLSWPDKRLGCFKTNPYKALSYLLNQSAKEDKLKEELSKGKNPLHKQKVQHRPER